MQVMFKKFGVGLLTIGILMAGAAGWMPGMNQVAELVPQTIIFKFAGGVAAAGILLLLIGKMLKGRKAKPAALQDEGRCCHVKAGRRRQRHFQVLLRS
jgi:hypothetical protein